MSELSVILPERIKILSGWGDTKIQWTLKMITVYEENKYLDRVVATEDEDKAKRLNEYNALIDVFVSWNSDMPVLVKGEERQPLAADTDFGAAIRGFFSDWSPAKERLLNTTLVRYRTAMVPEVSFL